VIERVQPAEEIAMRKRETLQLLLVVFDGAREHAGGDAEIVAANEPAERGTFVARRVAVAANEIRLRAQREHPVAINVGAGVAEKIGRREERVALEDVAIEIWQRLDVL